MNQTTPHDGDMPAEIDFSGGKRGQFHQAAAQSRGVAMTTVQITLPDELAQMADSAGLLSAEAMEAMLREQLRRRAGEAMQDIWQRQAAEEVTQEELERLSEEVRQLLAERRRRQAR